MKRVPVESSVLASVLYRPKLRLLEVEFRSGEFYRYFDVPPKSYNELLNAESCGRYFNLNIRNRFNGKHIHSPLQVGRAGA